MPNKPIKPESDAQTKQVSDKRNNAGVGANAPKAYSVDELRTLQAKASKQGNWSDYLVYSTLLWQHSSVDSAYQAQIEDQAWSVLNSLSPQILATLENSHHAEVQAWLALLKTFQGSRYEIRQNLMNLNSFESEAIFHKHLLPKLIAQQPPEETVKQIAVLLPMEGRYKVVSQQIRSGIMKAFFASDQSITLKFYDTTSLENLESVYTQAKQEGADRIIGPLRKEALQELASFHDDKLLALNNIDSNSFTQFSFKAAQPSLQMVKKFEDAGFQRIGILANDGKSSMVKAKALENAWKQANHQAILSVYPDENPKLREALGSLIHENLSESRQNNLRWLIGEQLNFFPRTRQDLDAIVIFDNAYRMAVFRPQFDFFELDTPVFGDSELTPANFQEIPQNRDLNRVSFLTYPATLNPVDLNSKFEAFGWDSFMVSTHIEDLQNGGCLAEAKTGVLSLDGNEIRQRLVWAKYDKEGFLIEAPTQDAKELVNSTRNTDLD
ncbi:hypothetical protein THMIRHAM_16700 [Thiomicrorhabdus immobilis]|uniref:LppC family lipoprotein n=1 Tax=Thiomicrorhabdus immobilis TaxID=2791037 RepID=A0ABN6D187_9GAMM|nr:hypothetical protein THMIRHAM_16700 [Thiomicrorhabdus immobilis]